MWLVGDWFGWMSSSSRKQQHHHESAVCRRPSTHATTAPAPPNSKQTKRKQKPHPRVGVHVGRGDVLARAYDLLDRLHQLPRQLLQLPLRQLLGVDRHAALGAAEGDVHHGGLPGHQRREAADVVEVDGGVVAEAALEGAAAVVVLHAVGVEDLDLACLLSRGAGGTCVVLGDVCCVCVCGGVMAFVRPACSRAVGGGTRARAVLQPSPAAVMIAAVIQTFAHRCPSARPAPRPSRGWGSRGASEAARGTRAGPGPAYFSGEGARKKELDHRSDAASASVLNPVFCAKLRRLCTTIDAPVFPIRHLTSRRNVLVMSAWLTLRVEAGRAPESAAPLLGPLPAAVAAAADASLWPAASHAGPPRTPRIAEESIIESDRRAPLEGTGYNGLRRAEEPRRSLMVRRHTGADVDVDDAAASQTRCGYATTKRPVYTYLYE